MATPQTSGITKKDALAIVERCKARASANSRRAQGTHFTEFQYSVLQARFAVKPAPKAREQSALSQAIGMTPKQIEDWFKHASKKAKKFPKTKDKAILKILKDAKKEIGRFPYTHLSLKNRAVLSAWFEINDRISAQEQVELGKELGIRGLSIQYWFHSRRKKVRNGRAVEEAVYDPEDEEDEEDEDESEDDEREDREESEDQDSTDSEADHEEEDRQLQEDPEDQDPMEDAEDELEDPEDQGELDPMEDSEDGLKSPEAQDQDPIEDAEDELEDPEDQEEQDLMEEQDPADSEETDAQNPMDSEDDEARQAENLQELPEDQEEQGPMEDSEDDVEESEAQDQTPANSNGQISDQELDVQEQNGAATSQDLSEHQVAEMLAQLPQGLNQHQIDYQNDLFMDF